MIDKKVVQLAAEVASYMTGSPFENHELILALVDAVRQDALNKLGKSGVLSWGKVAEIQSEK
jgi:hypothetical protein